MTYEEFKKELRWNVQNMETAQGQDHTPAGTAHGMR